MSDSLFYPSVPVGTLLIYALSTEKTQQEFQPEGWLICDGSLYSNQDFMELYQVIGETYGGKTGQFAVPDLRGLFLRGVSGNSSQGFDPDANSRTAPRSDLQNQGNSGNAIGSLQMDAFRGHFHQYQNYGQTLKTSHTDGHACLGVGTTDTETSTTGGSETRPVNQYVYFLIKAINVSNAIPVGGVIAYAAEFPQPSPEGWLPCVGSSQSLDDFPSGYGNLFAQAYGAADQNSCYVPDYRGRFLRGVDPNGQYDPDYHNRTAPNPGGNQGGHVGSVQVSGFASHNHDYQYNSNVWHCAATLIGDHAQGTSPVNPLITGGVASVHETRPVNLNVNFLVRTQQELATTKALLPVGSIIPYAGSTGANEEQSLIDLGYLPCDGRQLSSSTPQYQALYATIGNSYGADNQGNFYLPDYRGLFLRGTDLGAGRDPSSAQRTAPRPDLAFPGNQQDAVGSFQADALESHLHTYDLADSSTWHHINKGGRDTGVYSSKYFNLKESSSVGGSETRPRNAYVNFLIAFKSQNG